MQKKMLWTTGTLFLGFFLVLGLWGCSGDAVDIPTASSGLSSTPEMNRVSAQASNGSSNDHDNDNTGNQGPGTGEAGDRLRGLLFGITDGPCAGCFTLMMKQGSAVVDLDTRLEREVAGVEQPLTLDEFRALLRPGLPLRVTLRRSPSSTPSATRAGIDDEVQASGAINLSREELLASPSREFMLLVNGLAQPVVFRLAPNAQLDPFRAGIGRE
jgi:hypothetical protein